MKEKRALQVKERELAQREEALKTQSPSDDFISKADLLANPLKIFEAGLTYDQLTEAILNNPNGQTNIDLENKIKALEERLDSKFSERDQTAEQQVLAQIKRDVTSLVDTGEEFEAIKAANASQKVVDLIHRTWKQTGEVLGEREAADLIENQLIEDALPFTKLKKVQSRLTPQEVVTQQAPTQDPNRRVMRTLTNRDSSAGGSQSRRDRMLSGFLWT